MNNTENKIYLSPETVKLYEEISKKKEIRIEELLEVTKLNRGKLEYYLSFLVSEKLVERNDIINKKLKLTKTGLDAAKNGLIERRIIKILKEKSSVSFPELSKLIQSDKKEMNAGIGLLKKQNILEIENGQISLIDENIDFNLDLQSVLEDLKTKQIDDAGINTDVIVKRNLGVLEDKKETILKTIVDYSKTKDRIEKTIEASRLTPEMIRDGSWKTIRLKEYNLKVSPPNYFVGRKQPYAQFLDDVKRKLVALGFQEMRGPIVELEFWNFDALFQAQDHPAREWSDVYRVSNPQKGSLPQEEYVELVQKVHENGYDTGSKGWRYKWDSKKSARMVLRAQGTSVSARTLVDLPVPSKYFSISRCYRPDTVDATHLSEFNQVEGIVADSSITFRDLLGILDTFAKDIAGAKEFAFKPDYYPFTEPSVELSTVDPNLGRIEFGGAGIFRPEVTRPFGIEVPVIAWGLGIDRLFMVKHEITDIRELFSYKLDWLREEKMV